MEITPSKPAAAGPRGLSRTDLPGAGKPAREASATGPRAADDSLELSSGARRLAEVTRELESPERAERIQRLTAEVREGAFNTAERAALSAGRMLE